MAAPQLSADLIAWAQVAGYTTTHDNDLAELRPFNGANTRYLVYPEDTTKVRLIRNDPEDGESATVLLVAPLKVVEHHLYCVFGDDIRDDLALPYLPLPWQPTDLARGYTLTTHVSGMHVLIHHSRGAVAATPPDPTLGLLTLVPLSHLLGFSAAELRRAFMALDGATLMSAGYYASR